MAEKKEKKKTETTENAVAVLDGREKLMEEIAETVPQLFAEAQRNLLLNETPRYKIKRRKGKEGQKWDYVDVGYVVEQLNAITGHKWDFEILWQTTIEEALKVKQAIVRGRLKIYGKDGLEVVKTQYGNADIKMKRDKSTFLDFGNDLKAAASDCLKKCASQFGVALDVYSGAVKRRQDTEDPEGLITEGQRRRLEVLAEEAGIGHSGLHKLACELYDYQSTKDIQRRHFRAIQSELEEKVSVVVEKDNPIPEDIDSLFDIIGTPLGKRLAMFRAYEEKSSLEELSKKLNQIIDKAVLEEDTKGADK